MRRVAAPAIGLVAAGGARRPEERSRLDQTEVAQPALFALQVALAAFGNRGACRPTAVVGHSVGEIAALHVAGVLELREAIRVVWHRGHIMQQATGLGRMASVGLTEAEADGTRGAYGDRLGSRLPSTARAVSCCPVSPQRSEAALRH